MKRRLGKEIGSNGKPGPERKKEEKIVGKI